MSRISRRRFVAGAAAVGGAAALGPDLARTLARANDRMTLPKARPLGSPGGDHPIEHVVVLTMENRSFDHFFASLRFAEGSGRTDVAGHDGPETGHFNPWKDTAGGPDDGVDVFGLTSSTCTRLDPPHEWESVRLQYAGGAEDGYLHAVEHHHDYQSASDREPDAHEVMGYFTRRELPFSYAVADEYTICDAYRSPISGPTLPNRHYLHTGSSHGIWDNHLDSEPRGSTGPSPLGNPLVGFDWPTVYDHIDATALDQNRPIDWRVYFVEAPFTMLYSRPRLAHPERFAPFSQFLADAAAGTLASMTTIDPGYFTASDHSPQNVQLGQLFIASVYYALAASPAWDKTVLIVTYDEDGGYYDSGGHLFVPDERGSWTWNETDGAAARASWNPEHDLPPDRPSSDYTGMLDEGSSPYHHAPDGQESLYADFSLTGGRLPTMVMGPWVRGTGGGNVDHTPMDHASIIAFVADCLDLPDDVTHPATGEVHSLTMRARYRRHSSWGPDPQDPGGPTLVGAFAQTLDLSGRPRDPVLLDVPSFHATMFTDCNTLFTPATPYVPGPRGADNPGLDLSQLLRYCIGEGNLPEVPASQVRQTYLDAFGLVEEAARGDLLGIRRSYR